MAEPKRQLWLINDFSGGFSKGESFVKEHPAFLAGEGLDYRSTPNYLTALPKTTKDSGDYVLDLIKWMFLVGSEIAGYGDAGKLYLTSSQAWQAAVNAPESGFAGQGADYFNDYIYYRGTTALGRYGPISGSPSAADDFKTGLESISAWGPVKHFPAQNILCVANGKYLATLDDAEVWDADAIEFPNGWEVRSLEPAGDFMAIGLWRPSDGLSSRIGYIFYWDGTLGSRPQYVTGIPDGGISAIVAQGGRQIVFPGLFGNIYEAFTEVPFVAPPFKQLPLIGDGKTVEIYPGAVGTHKGMVIFGIGGGTSTTVKRGVYSLGALTRDQVGSLNLDSIISTGTKTGTGLKIGSLLSVSPTQLYIAWKDGAVYGVDLIDDSAPFASVTYESCIFDDNTPHLRKDGYVFRITCLPLASGEKIELKYKKDRAASWAAFDPVFTLDYAVDEDIQEKKYEVFGDFDFRELQIQLTFTSSATAAKLTSVSLEYAQNRLVGD